MTVTPAGPVLCVGLNPAWDVTYSLTEPDSLRPGHSHRVAVSGARAGGKAINVARVLHRLGVPTLSTGLVGGKRGRAIQDELTTAGLPHRFAALTAESRRTTAVIVADQATLLNEQGPTVTAAPWRAFLDLVDQLWAQASVVVLTGSLPPGVPPDAYRMLVERAARHGRSTVVDAAGAALWHALAAGPTLVKPNAEEAGAALGRPVRDAADAVAAGRRLVAAGAGAAVLTLGRDGMVGVDDRVQVSARCPVAVPGNPTGAGDAATAGLARALRDGRAWPTALAEAAALGAAAVACPQAGSVDLDLADQLRGAIVVRHDITGDGGAPGRPDPPDTDRAPHPATTGTGGSA